jgi:molecular chaperone GrpE
LTPQKIDAVLAEFRAWLEQAAAGAMDEAGRSQVVAAATYPPAYDQQPAEEPLDLHTLLAQFTALRHEVNLQTKASRAQQEQHAEALARLSDALDALEQQRLRPSPPPSSADESARALLKTLVELHDNLALAQREVQRVQDAVRPLLEQLVHPETNRESVRAALSPSLPLDAPDSPARRTFWARWFGRKDRTHAVLANALAAARRQLQEASVREELRRQAADRANQYVASIMTGYTMGMQRVERALEQSGLEAIAAVGQAFDPETMEALEVTHEAGRTTTEVVQEIRRGYLWRGQLFRCAQVRVARALPT